MRTGARIGWKIGGVEIDAEEVSMSAFLIGGRGLHLGEMGARGGTLAEM